MTINNLLLDDYFILLFILIVSTYYYKYYNSKEHFLPSLFLNNYNPTRLFPLLPKELDERSFILLNSLYTYLENRDRSVLNDPLVAPERRVPLDQYPVRLNNIINVPTRGYPENFQLVGMVSRKVDEKILQLYGRPTYSGSNQWEYFIRTEQNGFVNKIPIEYKHGKEIQDGDTLDVMGMDNSKGLFTVKLYNYNTPRYNPYNY